MQDILAYVENSESWAPSVEYAARLAAAFDASLTGAYVCPSPVAVMPAYDAPGLLANLIESTRQLEDIAFAARGSFISWAEGMGVPRASWQVAEGYLPSVLEQIGNWHDLLVLGRAVDAPWGTAQTLGNLVLSAGLPCIVVPPQHAGGFALDSVALAWNGTAEAIRAIHAARPLIRRAGRVVVLRGENRHPASGVGWKPEFELSAYLQHHGIQAEEQSIASTDDDAGASLLDAASKLHADLLVMGAYGRTRFSEWIFGGATRHVLGHASMPVLMRH
jgi:nucleotide-binding universal stress UspA family protein